jgi:hypothetical protein
MNIHCGDRVRGARDIHVHFCVHVENVALELVFGGHF